MSRYITDTGGSFEDPPLGNHLGICYRIIDLGLQPESPRFPGSGPKNKIMLSFELPNEKMTDGKPFSASQILNASLNEKATFRHWLEAWRGRAFTQAELEKFDTMSVLGKPCMVNMVSKDERVRIGSVAAVPKGMSIPALTNPKVAFWLDEWDQEVFESLSEKVQAMIKASADYAERLAKAKGDATQHQPGYDDAPIEDDIIF